MVAIVYPGFTADEPTAAGRALVTALDATAQRSLLGLGFTIPADAAVVHLAGTETISGAKTFTSGLIIKGAAGQTASMQEWQDSAGSVLGSFIAAYDSVVQRSALFAGTAFMGSAAGGHATFGISNASGNGFVWVNQAGLGLPAGRFLGWGSDNEQMRGPNSGWVDTKLQRVVAGIVGAYQANGTTLGTLQAAQFHTVKAGIYNTWLSGVDGYGPFAIDPSNAQFQFSPPAAGAAKFSMSWNGDFWSAGGWRIGGSYDARQAHVKSPGANIVGVFHADGTTLGTLQAVTIDNPSAVLTLGNTTYGVSVPGQVSYYGSGTGGYRDFVVAGGGLVRQADVMSFENLSHGAIACAVNLVNATLGFCPGSSYAADVRLTRHATGPALQAQADGGLRLTSLAGAGYGKLVLYSEAYPANAQPQMLGGHEMAASPTIRSNATIFGMNLAASHATNDVRFLVRGDGPDTLTVGKDFAIGWEALKYGTPATFGVTVDTKFQRISAGVIGAYASGTTLGTMRVGILDYAKSGIYNTLITGTDAYGAFSVYASNAQYMFAPPAAANAAQFSMSYNGDFWSAGGWRVGGTYDSRSAHIKSPSSNTVGIYQANGTTLGALTAGTGAFSGLVTAAQVYVTATSAGAMTLGSADHYGTTALLVDSYGDLYLRNIIQHYTGYGYGSARFRMLATGQRNSEVGDGAGAWQTGYREEYNVGGIRCGFYNATPIARQQINSGSATLAADLLTALTNLGLVQAL